MVYILEKKGYLFEKIEYTDTGKQNIDKLVNTINKLQSDTNIPTYFLFIPNSIYINQEKLP